MNAATNPIALTIRDAVQLSGVSRSTLYRAIKTGDVVARKHGRRTIILADELRAWLQDLPKLDNTKNA